MPMIPPPKPKPRWDVELMEAIDVVAFMGFCIGLVFMMLGVMTALVGLFLLYAMFGIIGIGMVLFGLAVSLVFAGVGCFIERNSN